MCKLSKSSKKLICGSDFLPLNEKQKITIQTVSKTINAKTIAINKVQPSINGVGSLNQKSMLKFVS